MRVGIVIVYENSKQKMTDIASGLAEGISQSGHQVQVIDGVLDNDKKLTFFEYLIVGTESVSAWGGKIPEKLKYFLSQSGSVSGRKSFAFVLKKGFRTGKTLSTLMRAMEFEGMFIKYSEILRSREEGREVGKRLHIDRA